MKTALVTGGNRGIGFAISRGLAREEFHVFLTARDAEEGKKACEKLEKEGFKSVEFLALDITRNKSINAAVERIAQKTGRLDALINNAGVFADSGMDALSVTREVIEETFATNTLGPFFITRAFVPLLEKAVEASGSAQVVNLSSGMGQLSDMGGGSPAYRISKTALNAVTRIFAAELGGKRIRVNAMCPGWVHTRMGGAQAPRTPEQGAATGVWLAGGGAGSETGEFWRDQKKIAW